MSSAARHLTLVAPPPVPAIPSLPGSRGFGDASYFHDAILQAARDACAYNHMLHDTRAVTLRRVTWWERLMGRLSIARFF